MAERHKKALFTIAGTSSGSIASTRDYGNTIHIRFVQTMQSGQKQDFLQECNGITGHRTNKKVFGAEEKASYIPFVVWRKDSQRQFF